MPAVYDLPELASIIELAQKKKLIVSLVGGFLRDQHLGRRGHDLDFIVSRGAVAFARACARKVRGAFVLLDKEAGCARVVKRINGEIWTYDFADLRAADIAGDIKKRDFTVNTIVADLMNLEPGQDIMSACRRNPKARADLKAGLVRMTSPEAFDDDPLRLLRAYSLSAQTGFKIEPKTAAAIRPRVRQIQQVSAERVREELFKIFETPRAAKVVRAMEQSGLLFAVLPQLKLTQTVPPGGYHHLNAWKHSLCALDEFEKLVKAGAAHAELQAYWADKIGGGHSRLAVVKFACLLHDVGKPDTMKKHPDGKLSFHGHERVGRDITRVICRDLMLSTAERHALEDMVQMHLRPGYMANFPNPPERMVFRFMRDARQEAVSILLLALADQFATRGELTTEEDVRHYEAMVWGLVDQYFTRRKEKPFIRLIDGNDLIKELKLKPGPVFKKILTDVEEAQHLGKVTDRVQALEFAARMAAQY